MSIDVVRLSLAAMVLASTGLATSIVAAVTVSDQDQIRAVIESVDPATRQVWLRGPQGGMIIVTAGPEVRNFGQLTRGDQVVVTYQEALAAELAKPGSSAPPPQMVERTNRAASGATPGASAERMIRARVRITGISRQHSTVSFLGPAKVERTINVTDPDMQNFLKTLKIGDEVDLAYTEAVAVSVEKAAN
jgi:hypothetical protein